MRKTGTDESIDLQAEEFPNLSKMRFHLYFLK